MAANLENALVLLRSLDALQDIVFDAEGRSEVFVPEIGDISLRAFDDQIVATCRMPKVECDEESLRHILIANCLGDAVGAGRLAIEPIDGSVIFRQQFNLQIFDGDAFVDDFSVFLQYAAVWSQNGVSLVAAGNE